MVPSHADDALPARRVAPLDDAILGLEPASNLDAVLGADLSNAAAIVRSYFVAFYLRDPALGLADTTRGLGVVALAAAGRLAGSTVFPEMLPALATRRTRVVGATVAVLDIGAALLAARAAFLSNGPALLARTALLSNRAALLAVR